MLPRLRLLPLFAVACAIHATPVVIEVGPDHEVRSLEAARDRLRTLRQAGELNEGAVVNIAPGVYELENSFTLESDDSGRDRAPIVWQAAKPGTVNLTGSRLISRVATLVETDPVLASRLTAAVRNDVVVIDLREAGVTDLGEIEQRGNPGLELFFNGERMPLSRYPNRGWLTIADVPQSGPTRFLEGLERERRFDGVPAGRHYGRITYDGDRPSGWSEDNDIYLHGYWTWDWNDSFQRIESIDTEAQEITIAPPHHNYGYTRNQRYRVLNVVEELDEAGEWCFDRSAGRLYFLPPSVVTPESIRVSVLEAPLLQLKEVSHVTFSGLVLEASRGSGLVIEGGTGNLIEGCTLRNLGGEALMIEGGREHVVQSCDLYALSNGAVKVAGGDRTDLSPGGHRILNNHLHHYSQWLRTGQYGIRIEGVGQVVANNLIHDAPFSAIYLRGNDHLIELNEIHDVCQETGDAGAIYTGRDYTWQGNVVRHNYLHDLKGPGQHGVTAVYLDDFSSGFTVTGNIFYRAGRGVQVGGGRDNTVANNLFIDCVPAVHLDARGMGWASYFFNGQNTWLWDRFNELHADQPPYVDRYPRLRTILQDEPARPKGNIIARNLVLGGRWFDLFDYWAYDFHGTVAVQDNWVSSEAIVRRRAVPADDWDPYYLNSTTDEGYRTWRQDDPEMQAEYSGNRLTDRAPGTFDPQTLSFVPADPHALQEMGFTPIPTEQIGLQRDTWRTRLPARAD